MEVRIIVVDDFVHLPQIKVVCLQPPQRLLQLLHRDLAVASVGTHFRHQEHFVAPAAERLAHPFFAPAVVVFPGVERQASIDGFMHDAHRL